LSMRLVRFKKAITIMLRAKVRLRPDRMWPIASCAIRSAQAFAA